MELRTYSRPLFIVSLLALVAARATADDGAPRALEDRLVSVRESKPPAECLQRQAEDFLPMTRSERLSHALGSAVGPSSFMIATFRAGLNQAVGSPEEYGGGTEGFALRLGNVYARHLMGEIFRQGIAYARHEDNRYFASGETGGKRRLMYAIKSAVLARKEDGSRTISTSVIGGAFGGAFVARTWQPRSSTTVADAFVSAGFTFAARAGFNVVREFLPKFAGLLP